MPQAAHEDTAVTVAVSDVEAYTCALRRSYVEASAEEQARFGAFTVEALLARIYDRFYTARGQPCLPDALPFTIQQVPSLASVAALQARITARVYAAVLTRPVVTVYDLECETCLDENVDDYAELGLGPGLQCLPVVQQYFQVRSTMTVLPVTSYAFTQFLLCTVEAEAALLHGGGDARDAVNAFARYYETHLAAPGTRVGNSRELGIHLENFGAFVNTLQQQRAQRELVLHQATEVARCRATQNASLYRAVTASLDSALSLPREHAARSGDETCPRHIGAQLSGSTTMVQTAILPVLDFAVHMSETEARKTSVPPCLWRSDGRATTDTTSASTDAPAGGVCLLFRLCAPPRTTTETFTTGAVRSTQNHQPCVSSTSASPRSRVMAPTATQLLMSETDSLLGQRQQEEPQPRRPRRRGTVVICADEATLPAINTSPAFTAAAGQCATGTTLRQAGEIPVKASATPCGTSQILCSDGDRPRRTAAMSLSQLDKCAADMSARAFAEAAIDTLSELQVSDLLPVRALRSLYHRLHKAAVADDDTRNWLRQCVATPCIPLPHPTPHTTTVDDENGEQTWEVLYVAAANEVFWHALVEPDIADDHDARPAATTYSTLFYFALQPFYGDDLRCFFCDVMDVTTHATVTAWFASCAVHVRLGPAGVLRDAGYLRSYVHTFTLHVITNYGTRLRAIREARLRASPDTSASPESMREDGEQAMRAVVDSVPSEVARVLYWLPLCGAWRRAVEGVYFANGQVYCDLAGQPRLLPCRSMETMQPLYKPPRTAVPLSGLLLLLPFPGDVPFVVAAVLERCGVRPLSAFLSRSVSWQDAPRCSSVGPAASALLASVELHRRVAAVVPFVQVLFFQHDPVLYALSRGALERRLHTFRVVLGCHVRLRDCLRDAGLGAVFCMTSSVRLAYVAEHNTLYGEQEGYTSRVLAEAVLPMFLPLAPAHPSLRVRLHHALTTLFASLIDATGDSFLSTRDAVGNGCRPDDCGAVTLSPLTPQVQEALLRAADDLGIDPALLRSHDIVGGSVAAEPAARHLTHFPPGCAAMSSPAPHHIPARRLVPSATQGAPALTVSRFALRQEPTWCVRALPQWSSDVLEVDDKFAAREVPLSERPATDCAQVADSVADEEEGVIHFPVRVSRLSATRKRVREAVGGDEARLTSEPAASCAWIAERYVYEQLCARYADDAGVRVHWVNEKGEAGTPYDIVVTRSPLPRMSTRGGGGHGGSHHTRPLSREEVVAFVEVKSTVSRNRLDFELSLRELLFAARYGAAYKIYRVYHASTDASSRTMRTQVYEDLVQLWYKGKLTMTGEVRVLPTF